MPCVTDVDDVLQESYINLLRARSQGHIASTKAYLFTTVRNMALKFLRKRRIISPVPVADLPEWRVLDGEQDVLATVNAHLQDELIASAVAELPARCREIFLLRVSDGLSYTEISVRLAIGESTVRTQVARATEKCVRILRDRGVTSDR